MKIERNIYVNEEKAVSEIQILINKTFLLFFHHELLMSFIIIFNYVILACFLTPFFYIFILYILLLLCFIFILMQKLLSSLLA